MMFLFLFTFLAFITSCSHTPPLTHQELLVKKADQLRPPNFLTIEEVESDLQYLSRLVKQHYEDFPLFPTKTIHRLEQDLLEKRPYSELSSPPQLCQHIQEVLNQFPDTTLQVRILEPRLLCGLQKPFTYSDIGRNSASPNRWKLQVQTNSEGKKVLILGIRDFQRVPWARLRPRIARHMEIPTLILDLRGSRGHGALPTQILSRLIDRSLRDFTEWSVPPLEEQVLTLNRYKIKQQLKIKKGLKLKPREFHRMVLLEQRYVFRKPTKKKDQKRKLRSFVAPPILPLFQRDSMKRTFHLLIDSRCEGSCERLVTLLKQLPQTVVWGTPSEGRLHFRGLGAVLLPHSRIFLQLPLHYREFPQFIETTGHQVDFPIPPGEDGLSYILHNL